MKRLLFILPLLTLLLARHEGREDIFRQGGDAMMDSNLRKKLNLNPDKMKEQLRMALSE